MKLLAIDSSILEEYSVSRRLMGQFLDYWQDKYPTSQLTYRDLHAQPVNHLSSALLQAKHKAFGELSRSVQEELTFSEQLLNEFLEADELVIAAPMYNFTIPTQLKAWIDRILVAGRTFKYTEQGVIGLAGNKKVTIISTRGNHYSSDDVMKARDFQEHYLQTIFNFVGINPIHIIRAEGLHLSESVKNAAINQAERAITACFHV